MCFNLSRRGHTCSPVYNPPPGPPPQPIIVSSSRPPPVGSGSPSSSSTTNPPPWTAGVEAVHEWGLLSDAPDCEYKAGEEFCNDVENAVDTPHPLRSYQIDDIREKHGAAWCMEPPQIPLWSGISAFPALKQPRWSGTVDPTSAHIVTSSYCKSVCLLSNLPLIGHYYNVSSESKGGVYYEVKIMQMAGVISIGTACKPYPAWWRHAGWNRLSYALHLDDYRTFDGPDGGSDYEPLFSNNPKTGDGLCTTFGCGFDFSERSIFFTHEGIRLPNAYRGIYPGVYQTATPPEQYDVYAAIGVEGESNFSVNFGSESFLWAEGNLQHWKVENQFLSDDLPPYTLTSR